MKNKIMLFLLFFAISLQAKAVCTIVGPSTICVGVATPYTTSLPCVTGFWSISPSIVATITSGGIVTGSTAGTATITYDGCNCPNVTFTITVEALPAITGPTSVCVGSSITLTGTPSGGLWAGGGSFATITSGGVVTGIAPGISVFSYATACGTSTYSVTVSATPVISSSPILCVGGTSTLTSSIPGGTWTCSPSLVATIGASSGIATGLSIGPANITYVSPALCTALFVLTIVAPPLPIAGPGSVCLGSPAIFTDPSAGGTWSCTAGGSITSSGVFTGLMAGPATITYTLPGGCFVTAPVIIDPLPTITGPSSVCVGAIIPLTGSSPGTWTSGATGIAIVGMGSGVVTGISAGTVDITFTETSTGCTNTINILVNPLPVATASSNSPVCPTSGVLNLFGGPSGMTSYAWTGPGFTSSVQNPTSVTYPVSSGSYSYNLVVTDANGCVSLPASTSVTVGGALTIAVSETYPISVSGDNTYTYCPGTAGYMTLAASGAFTGSYTWALSTGLSCTACSSTNVTATATTTYTITGSYNGCTGSTTVNVLVPAAGTCSPCDYFKVTGNNPSASCTGCSDLQPFHTINSATVVGSSLLSNANYYVAQSTSITGTATISQDVFFMKNGIGVTIPNTADITFDKSHIFSCTWAGFTVNVNSTNAGKLAFKNGTLVEKATAAVTLSTGSYSSPTASVPSGYIVNSDDAILNNNHTGMSLNYWPSPSAVSSTTLPFQVINTIFCGRDFSVFSSGSTPALHYPFSWPGTGFLKTPTSTGAYNPSFNIDGYTATGSANTGLNLRGTYTNTSGSSNTYYNMVIGDNATANQNLFDKLTAYGVYCLDGANLVFVNNLFRNITGYTSQGIKAARNTSYSTNFQLLLQNDGSTSHATGNVFYNCGNSGGVPNVTVGGYYHVEARYNTMTSSNSISSTIIVTHGLTVSSSNFDLIDVENNHLCNIRNCIEVVTNGLTTGTYGDIKVNNNVISSSYWDGTGTAPAYDGTHFINSGIAIRDQRTYPSGYSYSISGSIDVSDNKINQLIGIGSPHTATVGNGIFQVGFRDYPSTITNNEISLNYASGLEGARGILSHTNVYSEITGNTITGPGYNTPTGVLATSNTINGKPMYGIYVTNAGRSADPNDFEISCNHISDLNFAFYFAGLNYVNWRNNTMLKDKYGLYIYDRIQQQGSLGDAIDNLWMDDGSGTWWGTAGCTSGIWQTWIPSAGSSVNSPLHVRPNPGSTPDYTPTNNGPGTSCGAPGGVRYSFASGSLVDATGGGSYSLPTPYVCGGSRSANPVNQYGVVEQQMFNSDYTIYPNPSNGSISINRHNSHDGVEMVKVINTLGQVVYDSKQQFSGGLAHISLSPKIPAGLYIIEVVSEKGHRHIEKIEIRK